MPPSDHDGAEDQLADHVPATAETVRRPGQADADAYAAVCRDDFEHDIEGGVTDGIGLELTRFRNDDEEHGEHNPPEIVRKLPAKLLADEVSPWLHTAGPIVMGETAQKTSKRICLGYFMPFNRIFRIYAKRAFFVDIGVSHGDDNGIHAYVHHDSIEYKQTDPEFSNIDNVKAARADSNRLEEAIDQSSTGG